MAPLLGQIVSALAVLHLPASLALPLAALDVPTADPVAPSPQCTAPKLRRSWHSLNDTERRAYLDAELCLMSKPAALGLRGARTRFDELQAVHVFQSDIAHFVGQFFPFHRLFMHAHEKLLETECGYTAGQP